MRFISVSRENHFPTFTKSKNKQTKNKENFKLYDSMLPDTFNQHFIVSKIELPKELCPL